jgi:hypothetical protein
LRTALSRCTAVDPAAFAAEHWSRSPLLTRAKELPAAFDDLLSVDDVDELVADRALRTPFFRTVREGSGLPAPLRSVNAGGRRIADVADPDALLAQHADGATLVLNALHRSHPPVARFCRQLAAELGHPTQCNAYVTPGGDSRGFDFHHDTHDVFVLQVSGRKRWVVHEPVLRLPLPSQAQAGSHLVPEGAEPLLDVELEAGDCLYLPRGFVHAALTTDEHSVHLTVGLLSVTWNDVLADAGRARRRRRAVPRRPAGADARAGARRRPGVPAPAPPPGSSSCRPSRCSSGWPPGWREPRRPSRCGCWPRPRPARTSSPAPPCARAPACAPGSSSAASRWCWCCPAARSPCPQVPALRWSACSPARARLPTSSRTTSTRSRPSCSPAGCCGRPWSSRADAGRAAAYGLRGAGSM